MKSVIPVMPMMLLLALAVCGTAVRASDPPPVTVQKPAVEVQEPAKKEEAVLVGPATREQIEGAAPEWVQAEVEAQPDAGKTKALAAVASGTEVTVFLGTWCGDSRREVPRFWRALDLVGGAVPFKISYVAVDRHKKEPAGPVTESGVQFLPTFIVRRDGREVGRIVETSPHGVENDLLALLTGQASGVIATREHLPQPGETRPQL
ncbi:MAG TPA: thioredoxin family protein [Thermoanaerobaculia bacterium]|nr:thioredoxin family protein [Thermoanaerobaculia bacterium]